MSGRIFLDGHMEVPAGRRAAIAKALPEHIALTRAEPGCLSFEVRFDPLDPERLLVSEIFASQQAFDAHQVRNKASAWASITRDLRRHYTITSED